MKIAVCGVTGLIGYTLKDFLVRQGCLVIPILRSDLSKGSIHIAKLLEGCNSVVNLAGAPILKRWNKKWMTEIFYSRINTTRILADAINSMDDPPKLFLSASAVGIYDNVNVHDEFSLNFSDDFLASVCQNWEAEALKINSVNCRLAIFRLGVVLSSKRGALCQMLPAFKFGVGGKIGSGLQYFPWIHLKDVHEAIYWAVINNNVMGVYNIVAPQIVTNAQFTKELGRAVNRPTLFTVPAFALKLLFGKAAMVLTSGQQVIPQRLLEAGFNFNFPKLKDALIKEC